MDDDLLGQVFAMAYDEVQARFLNTVGRTARRTWKDYELQCCRVADRLDRDGKEFVKRLAAFVESDERKEP